MAAKGVVGLMGDRTSRYSDEPVSIWTRKASGITKVEDLAGRKIGTPVGGTADEYLGVVLAKKNGSPARRSACSTSRPATSSRRCRAAAWTPWRAGSPSARWCRPRVPDAVLVTRGGGHIGYYINMARAERGHRQEARAGRALRHRHGRGHPVHPPAPGRGRRDRHALGARPRRRGRPTGAPSHDLRSPHHPAHGGGVGGERARSWSSRRSSSRRCRGSKASSCASSRR